MRGTRSAAMVMCLVCASVFGAMGARELIEELAPYKDQYITVPCSPSRVGSLPACYNASIKAENNMDYVWGSPSINYPKDGSAWGVHISGPYPDSKTYLFSWHSGAATVGASATLPTDYCKSTPSVKFSPDKGGKEMVYKGASISYQRDYLQAAQANYSYASPCIHHVVVGGLAPGVSYKYWVSVDGKTYGKPKAFKTLKVGSKVYPLKVGLIADLGQTNNSTETRDHAYANKPDVIFFPGDHSYADDYGPETNDKLFGSGTNQNRWDSYMYLMEKLFSKVPVVTCYGNHEIDNAGIAGTVNYTTTSFSYPEDYPFQSASHRWPALGVTSGWTNITQSLYYSTVVGGQIKVIAMNNYIPFGPGTPQYAWASKELASVDKKATPWLVVMFHAPPYHTYFTHYKEMDYFLSVYEELFYKAGVDFVFNGHVHAYERTHPVYKYQRDDCGPMYVTIGDGGNIEGPYRNFVDQTNPYANNVTYCSTLAYGGKSPNDLQASNGVWGPSYQTEAYPPGAQTLSWQSAYGVDGGAVLVPLATNKTVGFCQSSQPKWSAHRDPSFGHGILTFLSSTKAELQWYKNVQGKAVVADKTVVERKTCSIAHRMRRLAEMA